MCAIARSCVGESGFEKGGRRGVRAFSWAGEGGDEEEGKGKNAWSWDGRARQVVTRVSRKTWRRARNGRRRRRGTI